MSDRYEKEYDEIENLPRGILSSDMGPKFTATVLSMHKEEGKNGPQLKVEFHASTGETFTSTYRIPKKRTGKGQMDLLLRQLHKLNLHLKEIPGKTFEWQTMNLKELDPDCTMTGFDRPYPVKVVKAK